MGISRGLKFKIRAYQEQHGVNYTTARRAVLRAAAGQVDPSDLPALLMPFPDGPLTVPPGLSREERMDAVVRSLMDHLVANAVTSPARNPEGVLIPPPVEQVRHHLALSYELGEEEQLLIAQAVTSVAVVDELPECWRCHGTARYDVTVHVDDRPRGVGAYVCPEHYAVDGSGVLGGVGGDTYLMLDVEVPVEVRAAVNQYMAAQGRDWVAFDGI